MNFWAEGDDWQQLRDCISYSKRSARLTPWNRAVGIHKQWMGCVVVAVNTADSNAMWLWRDRRPFAWSLRCVSSRVHKKTINKARNPASAFKINPTASQSLICPSTFLRTPRAAPRAAPYWPSKGLMARNVYFVGWKIVVPIVTTCCTGFTH